jgi:hypothetical protein
VSHRASDRPLARCSIDAAESQPPGLLQSRSRYPQMTSRGRRGFWADGDVTDGIVTGPAGPAHPNTSVAGSRWPLGCLSAPAATPSPSSVRNDLDLQSLGGMPLQHGSLHPSVFLLLNTVVHISGGFKIAGYHSTEAYSSQKFLRQFDLPDYPINVTITSTDPSYYCVLFPGRPGKGLSAEGCAELPELKARGQHFWRVIYSIAPCRTSTCLISQFDLSPTGAGACCQQRASAANCRRRRCKCGLARVLSCRSGRPRLRSRAAPVSRSPPAPHGTPQRMGHGGLRRCRPRQRWAWGDQCLGGGAPSHA